MRRLESLEDRTLLNASIEIDADGLLTYKTDSAIVETLNVSVSGNVYTFSSTVDIDILTNDADLTVTGDGTGVVTVEDMTGLVIDVDFNADQVTVSSTNVGTAVNFNSTDATVNLGDGANPSGLGALLEPITVTGPGATTDNHLFLNNNGSTADTGYNLTATTLETSSTFGGLTYSGVRALSISGSTGAINNYTVSNTADGVEVFLIGADASSNTFVVEGTSSDADSFLSLAGGTGDNAYNIQAVSSPVSMLAGSGINTVRVGDGDVSGINAQFTVVSGPTGGDVDITVDNSTWTSAGVWNLAVQDAPPMSAELTGLGTNGLLVYEPAKTNTLTLSNAAGQANSLTVDFDNGNPLALAGAFGRLSYDGGYDGSSGSTSVLILKGGSFASETHNGQFTGGVIAFDDGGDHSEISYAGLSPNSVYDVVPATNYTFNNVGDPTIPVIIKEGDNSASTGDVQSLLISAPGSFVDTHVANKTNIVVDNASMPGESDVTVNYGIADPVEGLSTLTVLTGADNDVANLAALPPGVDVSLQQGAGDDQATVSIPGAAPASSTSLDGGTGDNTLTLDAGGLNVTPSNFSVGAGGSTVVSGAPLTGGAVSYTNYQQVTVNNLPPSAPPIVTGSTINAVQGQRLVDAIAGTFTTAALGAAAGDFAATIEWGDGTSSAGVIVQDAVNPAVFYVMGTHTYWENAPSLTTTVTVTGTGSSSFTQMINGVPVTFVTPASGTASADGTAVVDNAPIELTVNSFAGVENVTPASSDVVVATFTDLGDVNPADPNPVTRYVATIDWGDGSGVSTIPTSAITRNGTSNSYDITLPQHVYSTPGTYVVTVTVSDGGMPGAQDVVTATATGLAHVANAPLSAADPQPTIADANEGVLFVDQIIGSFTDANPLATADEFNATIDWGDGSPLSYGKVVQPGGVGTPFFVLGTHSYANAQRSTTQPNGQTSVDGPVATNGTFPIRIYVQDTHGAAVNLVNTINVTARTVTLSGRLNPASDSGISNSDAITSVTQPNFQGVASEPGAHVFLYATPFGGTTMLIGQATADASGAWSITSTTALTDGGYEIQAQAHNASGNSISALTAITPNLVIDTVGPRILDARFDNLDGQVVFTIEDFGAVSNAGSGVALASLMDANNYRFSLMSSPIRGYRGAPLWQVTSVHVDPGTTTGQQIVTVRINDGQPLRSGRYAFSVLSADSSNPNGVRDVAGNALDGEFQGTFPTGNGVPGGNFSTQLDVLHNFTHAPKPLVGPDAPTGSPLGRPGPAMVIGRNVPRPGAAAAQRFATARNVNRPSMADLAAARNAARPRLAAMMAARPRMAALLAR